MFVIQITHNWGVSYWNGSIPQNENDNVNGWGCEAKAVRWDNKEECEKAIVSLKRTGINYISALYLGYQLDSLKVKEVTDENQTVKSDLVSLDRYKRR